MNLDIVEGECKEIVSKFSSFDYLWLEDPNQSFAKFLEENEPEIKPPSEDDEETYDIT